jgi:4-hydroxy-2-oxoglutarate aldolase
LRDCRALALAEAAARAGFDVVLAAAPADVSSLNAGERMLWFRAIADRSPLPVMLYSEEQGVGSTLTLTEVAELALHPNILGMYDAVLSAGRYAALVEATKTVRREVTVTPVFAPVTGRMLAPEMVETKLVTIGAVGGGVALAPAGPQIRTRTKSVGFQVVAAGRIAGSVERLAAGVPALMPSLAAAAPQACHEVYAAFRDGDPALAALKAERLLAADDLTVTLGIAGIKHGCDLNGFAGGPPRLPRLALAAVDRERMEQALGNVHN